MTRPFPRAQAACTPTQSLARTHEPGARAPSARCGGGLIFLKTARRWRCPPAAAPAVPARWRHVFAEWSARGSGPGAPRAAARPRAQLPGAVGRQRRDVTGPGLQTAGRGGLASGSARNCRLRPRDPQLTAPTRFQYRVFDESEDTPATGPAVDETANDDSDVESSSSDNDDVDAAPGSQAQDSQEPSQRSQPRARARARAPLRVFDLEDGEPHAFPIHTIIVGHAGSQLDSNTDAFLALGIPQAKHKDLLLALSVNAVQRTHHSLVHYKRLCRGVAPARAGAPAAGVG